MTLCQAHFKSGLHREGWLYMHGHGLWMTLYDCMTVYPDCVLGPCRHGRRYTPSLVRVGLKVHHSVASVALDTVVEKRLQASATVWANGTEIGGKWVTVMSLQKLSCR